MADMRAGDPVKRFGRADKERQAVRDAPRELLSSPVSLTSLVLRNLSPIRLGMVPASPSRRICTRLNIRMEATALHAYKEQFVTTTSIAPCGHATAMPNPRRSRA